MQAQQSPVAFRVHSEEEEALPNAFPRARASSIDQGVERQIASLQHMVSREHLVDPIRLDNSSTISGDESSSNIYTRFAGKEALELWCRGRIMPAGIDIKGFHLMAWTESWADGKALCALLYASFPDNIGDFHSRPSPGQILQPHPSWTYFFN